MASAKRIWDIVPSRRNSEPIVTNRKHQRTPLNDISRHLIRYLDGSRDHLALVEALLGLVDRQVLVLHEEGRPVGDHKRARQILDGALQEALLFLAANALLVN